MLMNNHGSYIIPEFVLLAADNHIRPYFLIFHLTHCMQLLNVAVFQPYKHWHNDAIQKVMVEFNLEYFMTRFCEDLTKIRNNIFKKIIILTTFERSGMYFIDYTEIISLLRKFVSGTMQKKVAKKFFFSAISLSESELLRIRPQTLHEMKVGLNE